MLTIHKITYTSVASSKELTELSALLQDAVNGGASVGFLAPLSSEAAQSYWTETFSSLGEATHLWLAQENDEIVGAVQLVCASRENAHHRAEVQRLFVHSAHRGKGIASQLMSALESFAKEHGRTLLVLDTQTGSAAESIYRHLGWLEVGQIPNYAADPNGVLCATSYFYKQL